MLTSLMTGKKDFGIDALLLLDGDRYFIDDNGDFEVVFTVTRVAVTEHRPHGHKYSLVLLDAKGNRIVAFDNAHAVKKGAGKSKIKSKLYDHKHIRSRVTPYKFKDAETLLQDFWKEVGKVI